MLYTSRSKVNMSRLVYRLKQELGEPLTWVFKKGVTVDIGSGSTEEISEEVYIHRAIVFPIKYADEFKYSISYLATNKNFVYGGYFGASHLGIVIDVRDLSSDNVIGRTEDRVILQDGSEYEVSDVELGAFKTYYVVKLERIDNGLS